jgi:GNAT acetyltransferase-like protein
MTGRVAHERPFIFLFSDIVRQRYILMMSQPDFQPTLVGPTITVRPISKGDWTEMFAAGSDPEIWKVHPVPDRYTEMGFRKFLDSAIDSGMGFAFVDRASGRIIGSSRYYGYEPDLSEIEIGWTFLARSYWGGPANREELALAGCDDQDRRHQARGPVHPGVVRREAILHLRDYQGPVSAGRARAGGVRGGQGAAARCLICRSMRVPGARRR